MPAKETIQTKTNGLPNAAKESKGVVTNQATIDAVNPIPLDNAGIAFSFVSGNPYLPFLPPKDNYARLLLEAKLLSTTHNACVITKKDYCAGIGFQDADGKEFTPEMIDWFKSMNLHNQSIVVINRRKFESHFTWGNTPIEIVRFTVKSVKRVFVYVHDLQEWRLGRPDDEDDIVRYAIQSKLLRRDGFLTSAQIKTARKLPLYSQYNKKKDNWFVDANGAERTMIWYKNSVMGLPHYGLPSAVASMIYQINEYKGARYNLDNFENNMVVSAILALKGNLSQTEANKIGKQIISTHTGDGKRGRVAVIASEEGLTDSSMHNLDTTKDGSYIDADNLWTQKIILANQWDAVLAGIVSPATLGKGSGFITKIIEEKSNRVIKPAQNESIEEVWNTIFSIAQDWIKLPFDNYDMQYKNAIDISGLTDVDITPAVTRNEVRVAKGLQEDPTPAGKEYMKSTGVQSQQNTGGQNVPA